MGLRRIFAFLMALGLAMGLALTTSGENANSATPEQVIIDAYTYNREGDLSDFHLSVDALDRIYLQLYNTGKLPWYATESYQYSYTDDEQEQILSITPLPLYEAELDQPAYEEAAVQILEACVLPGMSQWQIALAIHDYLIANAAYDETEEKNSGYDILVNGTAMCAGYAEAYRDLLLQAGVECRYVASDEMEHAWNLVCIDGQWYHADLTWDDPTPDTAGYVSHEYFLLTDEEISAGEDPHYGWATDVTCADDRFSNSFWRDIHGQICYESKDTSYLIRSDDYCNSLYRRDEYTGQETHLYTETTRSVDIGHGRYKYAHCGLSLWNGRLWFNSLNALHSINTDGSGLQTEFSHVSDTYLYSSHVSGDGIRLTMMDHDGQSMDFSLEAPAFDGHVHSFIRTVTAPTCAEDGFTLSRCECGLEATGTQVEALGHDYQVEKQKQASLFAEGENTLSCTRCGHTYTETVPQMQPLEWVIKNGKLLVLVLLIPMIVLRSIRKKKKQRY